MNAIPIRLVWNHCYTAGYRCVFIRCADAYLDGLYMGRTMEEARKFVAELNDHRVPRGFAPVRLAE